MLGDVRRMEREADQEMDEALRHSREALQGEATWEGGSAVGRHCRVRPRCVGRGAVERHYRVRPRCVWGGAQ